MSDFYYFGQIRFLKEGFLGVPMSEKPECTRSTRGFRRQGQRRKHPLKTNLNFLRCILFVQV